MRAIPTVTGSPTRSRTAARRRAAMSTAVKLRDRGVATIGDLARLPGPALEAMLGRAAGRHLHALANLHDSRPVQLRPRRRSIGSQHAWGKARRSPAEIDADLVALVERVMRRVRGARRVGRTVVLRLRFDDFSRATRSTTLPDATADTQLILAALRGLFAAAIPMIRERGLTLVGITVTNLENANAAQLTLALHRRTGDAVDAAVDRVRERYGTAAITRAVLLGRDQGQEMPLLPD